MYLQNVKIMNISYIMSICMWSLCAALVTILAFTIPYQVAICLAVGGVILIVTAKKPEIGILGILILISSIIFEEELPIIPINIGSLHISDVLLIYLAMILFYKIFNDREFTFSKSPANLPLCLFYISALLSAFVAINYYGMEFNTVVRVLRAISYYLIYYIVTNLIKDKKQIEFLVNGMFIVAVIVALAMLTQAIIGDSVHLIPGRIEKSGTFEETYEALRLLPPGQTLLYILFVTAISVITLKRDSKMLLSSYFYMIMVLGMGVILTYNRTYWVAVIFVGTMFMLMIPYKNKMRLMSVTVLYMLMIAILFFTYGNENRFKETVESVSERFGSLVAGKELKQSASVDDRFRENEYAIAKIKEHPLLGIGLGNDYRPEIYDRKDELTYYVHNGYLWMLVDMGLLGFMLFMWFYSGFIIRCWKKWKFIEDTYLKALVVGFMLSGIGIIPMALFNPIFLQWFSIVNLAVIIGLTDSIINLDNKLMLAKIPA